MADVEERRYFALTLQEYHEKNHRVKSGEIAPMDLCGHCHRGQAKCRAKRVFVTVVEAIDHTKMLNGRRGHTTAPLMPYRCRWCLRWHLATPKRKARVRKAERLRRKFLIASVLGSVPLAWRHRKVADDQRAGMMRR